MFSTLVKKILFSAQSSVIYTKDYIKIILQRYGVVGIGLQFQHSIRQKRKEMLIINNKNR